MTRRRMETYNVITGNTVGLAPGAHDVGIVVGQDGDDIDTLGAELGELLDVLGDVVGRANGGEGTYRDCDCQWGESLGGKGEEKNWEKR
jgi:hypothetical protein